MQHQSSSAYLSKTPTILQISTPEQWDSLLSSPADVVLVDVHSAWCGPTSCLGATYARLVASASPLSLVIASAPASAIPSLAPFASSSRSSFLFFRHGSLGKVVVGPDEVALAAALTNLIPPSQRALHLKEAPHTKAPPARGWDIPLVISQRDEAVVLPQELYGLMLGIGWELVSSPDYQTSILPELWIYPDAQDDQIDAPSAPRKIAVLDGELVDGKIGLTSSMADIEIISGAHSLKMRGEKSTDSLGNDGGEGAARPGSSHAHGHNQSSHVRSGPDDAYAYVPVRSLDVSSRKIVLVLRFEHNFTHTNVPPSSLAHPDAADPNNDGVPPASSSSSTALSDSINNLPQESEPAPAEKNSSSASSELPTPSDPPTDGEEAHHLPPPPDPMEERAYINGMHRSVLAILKPFTFCAYVRLANVDKASSIQEITSYATPLSSAGPTVSFCPLLVIHVTSDGVIAVSQADTFESSADPAFTRSLTFWS